jgi:hypothetical protein
MLVSLSLCFNITFVFSLLKENSSLIGEERLLQVDIVQRKTHSAIFTTRLLSHGVMQKRLHVLVLS